MSTRRSRSTHPLERSRPVHRLVRRLRSASDPAEARHTVVVRGNRYAAYYRGRPGDAWTSAT